MKPKVFVSRRLPEHTMNRLGELFELSCNPHDRPLSPQELAEMSQGNEGLVSLLSDQIDEAYLTKVPSLQIVANYAVGYNNIDLKAAAARNITVTNTPGVLTETSADAAFALMLATARRIVEADRYMREQEWSGWYPTQFLGKDVWGAKLGIVGLGRIGEAVARRASGFSMEIGYWNRTRQSAERERELGITYRQLPELLTWADFVSLHLAYTPETHHLVDAKALAMMSPKSILINTSRGAVVDEQALVAALQSGQLAGAGLDVYEHEPQLHPDLRPLNNVVLLPHLGSASLATREGMGELVVKNLQAFFSGQPVMNPVPLNRKEGNS